MWQNEQSNVSHYTQPITPQLRELTRENCTFLLFSWPNKNLCSIQRWWLHIQLFQQHVFYVYVSVFFILSPTLTHADQLVKKYPNKPETEAHRKYQSWHSSSENEEKQENIHLLLLKPAVPSFRSCFFQARHIEWKETVLKDLLTKGLSQLETTILQNHRRRKFHIYTTNSADVPGMHL